MTLSDYMLRRNERPVTWWFVPSWIPSRTERYSWLRVALFTARCAGVYALLIWCIFWILFSGFFFGEGSEQMMRMRPWMIAAGAEFGALAGLCWGVLSRMCWNQRANRLNAASQGPEVTAPWPKLGFWKGAAPRLLYRLLIGFATPMLLFHAIENARGAWAWHQMKAQLKAAGECYELACIIPPPVSDDENFFATPFWKRYAYHRVIPDRPNESSIRWDYTNRAEIYRSFSLPKDPPSVAHSEGSRKNQRLDLAAWAERFRWSTTNQVTRRNDDWSEPKFPLPSTPGKPAEDVLLALSKFDSILSELSAAGSRPRNRYPYHFEEGFGTLLPNLSSMKSGARICQMRAVARLATGDIDGAAADVRLAFRLGEALNEDPFVISQFVRYACDEIALHALWEGLVDHRWTDGQLAGFQELLGARDYTRGMLHSLESERAVGNMEMSRISGNRRQRLTELDRMGSNDNGQESSLTDFMGLVAILMPDGWFRENQVGLLKGYQILLDSVRSEVEPTHRATALQFVYRNQNRADEYFQEARAHPSPRNFILGIFRPSLSKSSLKGHRIQTLARMGVIACALERYRLAHGEYPKTLDELKPAYLAAVPTDWMSDDPFHYQKTEDGWFRLWSVGPDGKDDGGVYRTVKQDGKTPSDDLDWSWPSPVKSLEPRMF
jgi:hypothetical protein